MSLSVQVAHFFREPTEEPVAYGVESTLYLLRREVQDCLIGEVVAEDQLLSRPERRRLFATALVVFAGIDLLAKFAQTQPNLGARQAFVVFLLRFCRNGGLAMDPEQAEIIWVFRNALVHSFGLHHLAPDGTVVPLWIFQQDHPAPVVASKYLVGGGLGWDLSIDDLVEMFLDGISSFRQALQSDADLGQAFVAAYDRYGTIHHRGPHIA